MLLLLFYVVFVVLLLILLHIMYQKKKTMSRDIYMSILYHLNINAAVAHWVRAFAPQAEGWMFESQPRQT